MGIVLNWNSTYPGGGIDDTTVNFPTMVDVVHNVMASHVNALAQAIIHLETAVGTNGGLTIREADSSPSVTPVQTIIVPNGSLTDLGGGTVELATSSGSLSPFPFRPTTADLGVPAVTGTITNIVITDEVFPGSISNVIYGIVTDASPGTIVQIPITLPVTPLPNRFNLEINLRTYAPDDFFFLLGFLDSTETLFCGHQLLALTASDTIPAMNITEVLSGVTTGTTWTFPNLTFSNNLRVYSQIEKNAPFNSTPAFSIDAVIGTGYADVQPVSSTAMSNLPSAGTLNAGWDTEDFVSAAIMLFFPNEIIGDAEFILALEFLPHVKDR